MINKTMINKTMVNKKMINKKMINKTTINKKNIVSSKKGDIEDIKEDIKKEVINSIIKDITKEHLEKYFRITGEALDKCKIALDSNRIITAKDFLDMAQRYYDDADYFYKKNNYVLAFAALNYAHGWLDAGARIKLFKVNDSRLFTVDD